MSAQELAAQIRTVQKLSELSQAMRQLAAARRGQAAQYFSGLLRYADATRHALEQGLSLLSGPTKQETETMGPAPLLVVCLSEHGFVGGLNEALLSRALVELAQTKPTPPLLVLGKRGQRYAEERGVPMFASMNMPTTLAAVSSTAQELVRVLFDRIGRGEVTEIDVVFAFLRGPATFEPRKERLFPPHVLPKMHSKEPPLHTLPVEQLTAQLLEEYVFAQVTFLIASAFASEQAARFSAMDSSYRNLQDRLTELRLLEQTERQDSITSEILEVSSASSLLLET